MPNLYANMIRAGYADIAILSDSWSLEYQLVKKTARYLKEHFFR